MSNLPNILTQIVDNKILEIDKLKENSVESLTPHYCHSELDSESQNAVGGYSEVLAPLKMTTPHYCHSELDSESRITNKFIQKSSKLQIIAEIKPKSPSAGILIKGNPLDLVAQYNQFASGISVLTDSEFFGGSFELLSQVRARTKLPILCKDFILDPIQIDLAKASGANLILLIVKILDPQKLRFLLNYTLSLGLQPVIEVNDKRELEIALEVIQSEQIMNRVQDDKRGVQGDNLIIIGINNRNLETLELDLQTSLDLVQYIPDEFIKFSLSGIKKTSDLELMSKAGFDGVLIGEGVIVGNLNDFDSSLY
jgi:indole-3-glycerol phosphate synthase